MSARQKPQGAIQKDIVKSIQTLRAEKNQQSQNKESIHDLASLYYLAGKYKSMASVLQSIPEPRTIHDLFLLILAYEGLKDKRRHALALAELLRHLSSRRSKKKPKTKPEETPWNKYLKAGIQQKLKGKYYPATVAFKHAIKIKPDFEAAHFELGRAYTLMKKLKEAIAAYRKALRINPKSPETLYALSLALKKSGDLGAAFDLYQILDKQDTAMERW